MYPAAIRLAGIFCTSEWILNNHKTKCYPKQLLGTLYLAKRIKKMYVQFGSRFGIIVNHCSLQCPVILLRQMFVFEFIGILVLQTLFGTWGWNLLNGFNQKLEPKSKSNRLFIINQG